MLTARQLFERHLTRLHRIAEKYGVHIAVVLEIELSDPVKSKVRAAAFGLPLPPQPSKESLDELAAVLIEQYRMRYIEEIADTLLRAEARYVSRRTGSKLGGKSRGEQIRLASIKRRDLILEKETELHAIGRPKRNLTKEIARALNEPTDYVRKVRGERTRTLKAALK